MESNKYPKPKLPTCQQVLEDIFDSDVVQPSKPTSFQDDELIQTAYNCYVDFTQLEQDMRKHEALHQSFNSLHAKLNESIHNMKKQISNT